MKGLAIKVATIVTSLAIFHLAKNYVGMSYEEILAEIENKLKNR